MKKHLITILALAGLAAGAHAATSVSGNITTNTTWGDGTNPSPIILNGAVFVKNNAKLTILPGTVVRGQPRTAAVTPGDPAGTPGTLIVTQQGRLVADGTAQSPIIFTTAAVDNNSDDVADTSGGFKVAWATGSDTFLDDTPETAPLAPLDKSGNGSNVALWGGIVVLGNAPINLANKYGVGHGKGLVEGLTVPGFPAADATYGGVLPHDNSGVLRYVSIRHAGDELGSSNELNGLTLAGVGDGTLIDYIDVYCNFDDGIEWFGGTVNGKHLMVSFVGDDMFDVDQGYTGTNQFLFGIMPFFAENDGGTYGSAGGDKAGEFDGDDNDHDDNALDGNVSIRLDIGDTALDATPWPLSGSAFYNLTVIGSSPGASPEFAVTSTLATTDNRGLQFRNGYAGAVFNAFIVNTLVTSNGKAIQVDTGTTAAPGFNASQNATNGILLVISSTTGGTGTALSATDSTTVTNGNTLATRLGGLANVIAGTNALTKADQSFNPTGNAAGKIDSSLKSSPINPRPVNALSGVVGGVPPQGPGLDSAATYRGAFQRTAPTLWTTDWTALNIGGLLAD
jgi:hypothetical protein